MYYENLKITISASDSDLIKTNGKYISVNWNTSGGGSFAVIPVKEVGKAPDQIPLFRGHTAQVLDTDFNPFNDEMIASASDDTRIGIWVVPENYSIQNAQDEETKDVKPVRFLTGHTRKVAHVLFHPTVQNILVSSSLDCTVRIWNVATGENLITLKHPDVVTSMSFSYNGDYLATVCRDKQIRVWDIRKKEILSKGQGHFGAKNQRVVWLGNTSRLATTGFSKLSDRQIAVWDAFDLGKGNLGGFYNIDQSSGILMPFYDESNKILYIAGKGDGNIRYYEFQDDGLYELAEYQSIEPQRGFAVAPKKCVNVKENEVVKAYKTVRDQCIELISFFVPRRTEVFHDDIYPDAPAGIPALTAEEWLQGKSVEGPVLLSLKSLYDSIEPTDLLTNKVHSISSHLKIDRSQSISRSNSTHIAGKTPTQKSTLSQSRGPQQINEEVLGRKKSLDTLLKTVSKLDPIENAEDPVSTTSGGSCGDEELPSYKLFLNEDTSIHLASNESVGIKSKTPVHSTSQRSSVSASPLKDMVKPFISDTTNKALMLSTKTFAEQNSSVPNLSASLKCMGLRHSIEKLSSLVLNLEDIVVKLTAASLEKDTRLQKLEEKIEELLGENKPVT